jgi:hypothetical protein
MTFVLDANVTSIGNLFHGDGQTKRHIGKRILTDLAVNVSYINRSV